MLRLFGHLAGTLNRDFCPGANRYVYWLKQPIGWFVLAAAAALSIGVSVATPARGLCGNFDGDPVRSGVALDRAARRLVPAAFRTAADDRGLGGRRPIGRRQSVALARLGIDCGARFFPVACQCGRRGYGGLSGPDSRLVTNDVSLGFEPECRGRYPRGVPRLACGFPFGIWHGHRPISVENELVVWPRMASLTSVPPLCGRSLAVAGIANRSAGQEGDLSGVRLFRPGDSLRRVHWAQSAKYDRLVVCERQGTGRRQVKLILDLDSLAQPNGVGTRPSKTSSASAH